MQSMYYIGMDVHKRTISYCVKDVAGKVLTEGKIPATRHCPSVSTGRTAGPVRGREANGRDEEFRTSPLRSILSANV
jgi:hypothetical protein